MKGLGEYFSKSLDMNVTLGNPWRRVIAKDDVAELVKKLGGSFAVAIGLALRGTEEYKRK
jgi:Tfp pilus assembly PilM family ATPase